RLSALGGLPAAAPFRADLAAGTRGRLTALPRAGITVAGAAVSHPAEAAVKALARSGLAAASLPIAIRGTSIATALADLAQAACEAFPGLPGAPRPPFPSTRIPLAGAAAVPLACVPQPAGPTVLPLVGSAASGVRLPSPAEVPQAAGKAAVSMVVMM